MTSGPACVLFPFVTAPANTAEPARCPVPLQDRPPPLSDPTATGTPRLLRLVRTLIVFGKTLTVSLRGNPSAKTVHDVGFRFGTFTVALILARITRALRLAVALEAKLLLRLGRPEPVRTPQGTPSKPSSPRAPSKPRTSRPKAPQPTDPDSLTIPTAEEIAEQLRTRPVHAVFLEICSNLGIVPADGLWNDIACALTEHGGSFPALWKDATKRIHASHSAVVNVPFVRTKLPEVWKFPLPTPTAAATLAAATGPP